jgi:uncharacterized protein (TIGR02598 family)
MRPPRNFQFRVPSAFSLVEVVIVIGIVAFAIIPLIGTLGLAHETSRSAQESMDLALVLQSSRGMLENMEPATRRAGLSAGGFTNYFAQGGRFLGSSSPGEQAFYRVTIVPDPAASSDNLARALLVAEYPAPSYGVRVETPVTFFSYGPR